MDPLAVAALLAFVGQFTLLWYRIGKLEGQIRGLNGRLDQGNPTSKKGGK